jgi:dihydroxyacetone kinase
MPEFVEVNTFHDDDDADGHAADDARVRLDLVDDLAEAADSSGSVRARRKTLAKVLERVSANWTSRKSEPR